MSCAKPVVAVVLGLTVFSASAVFSPPRAIASQFNTDTYNKLFPYHAAFCAVTQILKNEMPGRVTVRGGKGGHGALYIHGACRDLESPYPKIKVCDGNEAEQGVATSVNSDYDNVNWIAIENKEFFLRGGLTESQTLTEDVYKKTLTEAVSRQLFRGVKIHPELLNNPKLPAGTTAEQFLLEDSLSTDYAINFGRNLHCAYLPLKKQQIPMIVKKMNEINDEYYLAGKEYNWSGIKNNCTHTTHNALAAVGFWDEVLTDRTLIRQAFNLAVPANDFIDMVEIGNERSFEDVTELWFDKGRRENLMAHGWLPTQPGVIAENITIHAKNDLYEKNLQFLILDVPFVKPNEGKYDQILEVPEYTDLKANLLAFKVKYAKIKAAKRPLAIYSTPDRKGNYPFTTGSEFAAFYETYYKYIDDQIVDVDQKLQLIEGMN